MSNPAWISVFRVSGVDHVSFLQGQLTQDLQLLSDSRPAMLSACCDAKGRVIALLTLIHSSDSIVIALRADVAELWQTHILRYRMRAHVDIALEGEQQLIAHLATEGDDGFDLLTQQGTAAKQSWSLGGLNEQLRVPSKDIIALQNEDWQTQRIMAGVADVGPATSGAYTPHMLGLTALHAVSFEKGCYTGQEIIARTQHLGVAKRRPIRFRSEQRGMLIEGSPIMAKGKKVGSIAAAAAQYAIAVVSDFDDADLETESGQPLILL